MHHPKGCLPPEHWRIGPQPKRPPTRRPREGPDESVDVMPAVIAVVAAVIVVLRNADHAGNAAFNAADRRTDRAADDSADRACRAIALVGAFLRTADDALRLRRKRQAENEKGRQCEFLREFPHDVLHLGSQSKDQGSGGANSSVKFRTECRRHLVPDPCRNETAETGLCFMT